MFPSLIIFSSASKYQNGNITQESVNIKLYAETLNQERNLLREISNRESHENSGSGIARNRSSFTAETQSVSNGINQQIYDGKRYDNDAVSKYEIVTAKTGISEVKFADIVEKVGAEEIIKLLSKS